MSLIHESTEDILHAYKYPGKEKKDDITLYTDEDSIFDINKIINGSLDYGRSALDSPSKSRTNRASNKSPYKASLNNKNRHSEQARRMRDGIISNQTSPQKDGLSVSSSAKGFNESTLDDSIVRRLDEKISKNTIKEEKESAVDDDGLALAGLIEDSNTELIIKETHRLINSVPQNITSSREGERYIRLLGTSIKQLATQLNQARKENSSIKTSLEDSNSNYSSLEANMKQLDIENYSLREQVAQLQHELASKNTSPDSQLLHEKKLLREKLIKYKRQYEEEHKKNESLAEALSQAQNGISHFASSSAESQPPASLDREKLATIYNKLADILHCKHIDLAHAESISQPQKYPSSSSHSHREPEAPQPVSNTPPSSSNLKMLTLFESLLDNMQGRPNTAPAGPAAPGDSAGTSPPAASAGVNEPARSQSAVSSRATHRSSSRVSGSQAELLDRVLKTMDLNNDLYTKVLKLLGHARPLSAGTAAAPAKNVQSATKPYCQRCSSRNSDSAYVSAPDSRASHLPAATPLSISPLNDTVNLMGEYKWSI